MATSVELAVKMTADASDVAAEFDSAGTAALRMADDVDRASSMADSSASRLDSVADSADGMASSSSQAAGGLGDLGGALSGLPGPLGAAGRGMEAAAPAIMGVTGAADLLNLATSSTIVMKTREKAALVATTVVTKAQAAATLVATGAQKALNIAMRANPIGIIITAALLLVGVFVTLYRKSETFRNIVDTLKDKVTDAFGAMLKPIQWVIDKVQKVVGWIGDAIDATKRALGLGKEYGSTMGRILGTVADDLAAIGDQIRNNANASGQGGASGGGVGSPRLATGGVTIDARTEVRVDASSLYEQSTLLREIDDLLRRRNIRLGDLAVGAKVVTA